MNKKIITFVFLLVFLLQSGSSIGWDTTAAKFYPLQIGNVYIYHYYLTGDDCNLLIQDYGYKKIKIAKDTIMSNGFKYYKFEGANFFYTWWSNWRFQRIDSNTMNVYSFENGADILLDSLLAENSDRFDGNRNPTNYGVQPFIQNISSIFIFNQNRMSKSIYNDGIIRGWYNLVEEIGLYSMSFCKGGGNRHTLKGCVINGIVYGDTTLTGIQQLNSSIPDKFSLSQNYPNPFNPSTNLEFGISKSGFVTLKIYNMTGKELTRLVNSTLNPGTYSFEFNGESLPSGVYFYKLEAGEFVETKRMVLIK